MTRMIRFTLFFLVLRSPWHPDAHAASAPFKLIVGYATHNARITPLWIAQEQCFFAKYGIEPEQVYLRSAPILVSGLAAGSLHLGRSGGSATLAAGAAGHDFKIVATFSGHNTYDLVVRPNIKRAEDLRGKKFSVTSIGGTTWMGVLFWLEHLGLDQQRDQIHLQVIGDQNTQAQAVETGIVDAAVLDGVFSRQLQQKGMTILGEYPALNIPVVGQAMVVPRQFLQQRPEIVENYLKAEVEGLAFSFAPRNKPIIIKTLMRQLRTDPAGAEEGYLDLVRGVERKPFPSFDGLRNIQRVLKSRNPKIGEVKVEEVIDGRVMRKLDESGFIDRAYAAQGVSLKRN